MADPRKAFAGSGGSARGGTWQGEAGARGGRRSRASSPITRRPPPGQRTWPPPPHAETGPNDVAQQVVCCAPLPADETQSSSWGSSQRPPSHLCRSLAAAGRRSTRQTRLRTSEWMHQGGTMARHQVHRSRWIACRRRSAAPSITISRLSRGKTVEKCTGSRPARSKKSPSRERPRRGAAKPQSPAPRPNRPPGKKMHASPDRGGREASNEPL